MKSWKHNELAEDLGNVKQTNFLDIPLGSVTMEFNTQRADVLEVKPSYTRFCVSIYEVKISRADFQSDVRSGKWRGYLDHCHRFYFAVPAGMVEKQEVPPEAGLIVRGETGWSTLKAAKPRNIEIPYTTLLSLIFARQRINHSGLARERLYKLERYNQTKSFYKALGQRLGDALRNKDEYEMAKSNFERHTERVHELIREGLGENHYWPEWELRNLVRQIKEKAKAS
ncbi:hypothetical protein EDC14_1004144 [Hydrogenispora ethanolica]|jgi:hypothetical protein|uniref:MmcB family DNA repair protein n=1 Tax=Hydrogenispora ethanolica TaxID=1082276 RepID=A0A4R1S4K9_HYDET|nr:MmcB family DNA repair protein [Hydrogenispora ethanolica]TCL74206.1 hypothetical protein EDC14_1004144 [Hydrogenispora ethanolica]